MIVEDVLKSLAADLKTFAKTETIFGDPLEFQGTTIIPVCKMSMGYGGGGGEGEGTDEKHGRGKGSGGGAGAGPKIDPAALIIIKDGDISVVGVSGSSRWAELFEHLPETVSKFIESKKEKSKSESEKSSPASQNDHGE